MFVSSTIEDLHAERDGVDEELSSTEIFEVVRVERLPATGEPSRLVCFGEIAQADAIVLVLGTRYGFVPEMDNPSRLSVTHLEYREARRLAKPIFSFIRKDCTREVALEGFIKEVSDFHTGVLRKEWRSLDELRREVRRSLLFWLAREARNRRSKADQEQAAMHLARYPDVGELLIFFTSTEASSESLKAWQEDFSRQLDEKCRRYLLPIPNRRSNSAAPDEVFGLSLETQPGATDEYLRVSINFQHDNGLQVQPAFAVPIKLDVPRTLEGAMLAAEASVGLMLVATDDALRGIDQLSATAEGQNLTPSSRENLLAAAAVVSASNKGVRCFEVARRLLELPRLDSSTINAGVFCLTVAGVRFENERAHDAFAETERLVLQLLSAALLRSDASTELLYNLARRSLTHFPRFAQAFYDQLLRSDPSYDARWYFHRDLGLLEYHAGHLRNAGRHYDRACHLRSHDSELWRFAGDAYYYSGYWAEALIRYERATDIEPLEEWFLDFKVDFAQDKIRQGITAEKYFALWRSLSHKLSRLGVRVAEAGVTRFGDLLFRLAKVLCGMNLDADKWLALYANRQRSYSMAIKHLKGALAVVPEDPSLRLNLVLNQIFQDNGQFGEESRAHARVAIFHGGQEALGRFRIGLVNTANRAVLSQTFSEIMENVEQERKEYHKRRVNVLAPEEFGPAIHIEWRP